MIKCLKCNAENEDGATVCNSCGESMEIAYPREVFLNQVPRPYGPPTNLPIATMAFLELRKHKKGIIICLIIFVLIGIITYFFR